MDRRSPLCRLSRSRFQGLRKPRIDGLPQGILGMAQHAEQVFLREMFDLDDGLHSDDVRKLVFRSSKNKQPPGEDRQGHYNRNCQQIPLQRAP